MSLPRQVLPGRSYIIARRCVQREYLLRPDEHVGWIYRYCLAAAANRYDITLNGYIAMSNHSHVVARDNRGNLPAFMAYFHKTMATAINTYWGRRENLWCAKPPNAVYLVGAEDRFAKLIYLLVNPVADHLVARAHEWPGATSLRQNLGGDAELVTRPPFFRKDGPMPAEVELRIERVDGFGELTRAEWTERIANAVLAAELRAAAMRAERGFPVVGRDAVLRVLPTDRPATREPRAGLRPVVACRDAERRNAELHAVRLFRSKHRVAVQSWLAGDRSAPFPEGSHHMHMFPAAPLDGSNDGRVEVATGTVAAALSVGTNEPGSVGTNEPGSVGGDEPRSREGKGLIGWA